MVCADSGKRKRRLIRLAVAVAITAAIVGGVTWFAYVYVFKAGFAEVVPGTVYRSGQPSAGDVRAWVGRYGIRTIISLRGDTHEVAPEKAAAKELGVQVYCFKFSAGHLPPRDELLRFVETLQTAPRPILLHCRNGVDRTGMGSAVAALVVGKAGLAGAIKQLPWLRANPDSTHVSDVIGQYQAYCRGQGVSGDDPVTFTKWVAEVYQAQPQAGTQLVPRIPLWPGKPQD